VEKSSACFFFELEVTEKESLNLVQFETLVPAFQGHSGAKNSTKVYGSRTGGGWIAVWKLLVVVHENQETSRPNLSTSREAPDDVG
jgi:hypothetical protein